MVPGAARRPAVLGDAGGAGRRPVAGGVAAPGRARGGQRPGDLRRGVRRRAARAGPVDQPPADRRADPGHHRRRRGAGAAPGRARAGAGAARGRAEVLPRDRVLGGPGLRARRRDPRRLGRAAAGDAGRRAAARRLLGRAGQPGGRARAGRTPRRSRWRWAAPPAARWPPSCTPSTGPRGGSAWRSSAACTATGWSSSSAAPPTRSRRPRSCCPASATGRWWSVRPCRRWTRRPSRRGPRWPATARRRPGRPRRARWPPTTCCPSGRWPATATPGGGCATTCTGRWSRSGGELLETLDAFFAAGGVLESAARTLYVHPNTVRYRLKRVAEVTGFAPLNPRDAFALRVALTIGRLDPAAPVTPPARLSPARDGSRRGARRRSDGGRLVDRTPGACQRRLRAAFFAGAFGGALGGLLAGGRVFALAAGSSPSWPWPSWPEPAWRCSWSPSPSCRPWRWPWPRGRGRRWPSPRLVAVFLAGAAFGTLPLATISLKPAPGRNAGTDVFFTFTASPVRGLRAVRARAHALLEDTEAGDGNLVALGDRVLDLGEHRVERCGRRLLVPQTGGERFDELGLVHGFPPVRATGLSTSHSARTVCPLRSETQTCTGKKVLVSQRIRPHRMTRRGRIRLCGQASASRRPA